LQIVLSDVVVEEDIEERPGTILHYDQWGNLVGLIIAEASQRVLDPRTLEHTVIECGPESVIPALRETEREPDRISELFADGREIDQALKDAVQEALWRHKRLGNPVVGCRDGKMVWLSPEEIPVDQPPPPLANGQNGNVTTEL